MSNLDRRTTENFFSKKVPGSVRSEGGRHVAYRIFAPSGRLLLGNLTFSRGASGGDLDLRNLKGLANDVGLSLEGFVEASRCQIRQRVVVLCVISRILEDASEMHELDPIAFDDLLIVSLGAALEEWFQLVPDETGRKLTAKESRELGRCLKRLHDLPAGATFKGIINRYAIAASSLDNG